MNDGPLINSRYGEETTHQKNGLQSWSENEAELGESDVQQMREKYGFCGISGKKNRVEMSCNLLQGSHLQWIPMGSVGESINTHSYGVNLWSCVDGRCLNVQCVYTTFTRRLSDHSVGSLTHEITKEDRNRSPYLSERLRLHLKKSQRTLAYSIQENITVRRIVYGWQECQIRSQNVLLHTHL